MPARNATLLAVVPTALAHGKLGHLVPRFLKPEAGRHVQTDLRTSR